MNSSVIEEAELISQSLLVNTTLSELDLWGIGQKKKRKEKKNRTNHFCYFFFMNRK